MQIRAAEGKEGKTGSRYPACTCRRLVMNGKPGAQEGTKRGGEAGARHVQGLSEMCAKIEKGSLCACGALKGCRNLDSPVAFFDTPALGDTTRI